MDCSRMKSSLKPPMVAVELSDEAEITDACDGTS